ncbi:MAG: hypothetical protein JNM27_09750 [Leptospirales bacterium]|nr:hypothetical protein [Leptospirales bacterium]
MRRHSIRFSDYLYASGISALGELPLGQVPNTLLRFTYSQAFSGRYLLRLQSDGTIVMKTTRGETTPPKHMETLVPRFFNKESDLDPGGTVHEIETIPSEFYFQIPDVYSHNVIEERLQLPRNELEMIEQSLLEIQSRIENHSPIERHQLDGDSLQVELPYLNRAYDLCMWEGNGQGFDELVALTDRIRKQVRHLETKFFMAHRNPLGNINVAQLEVVLKNELDSTIAFLLAFAPTDTMNEFVKNLIPDRQGHIAKIAEGIDTTTTVNRERFGDLLRVLLRNIQTL